MRINPLERNIDNEASLLAAFAKGNHEAASKVFAQNYKIVKGWLLKAGCNEHDAEDLFQESLMVLYGKAQNAEFMLQCSINTYLMSVCKHLWFKKANKSKTNPIIADADEHHSDSMQMQYSIHVAEHEERELHYKKLEQALDALGEPCKKLIKAYYHHDMSMQQIASAFGYTSADNAKTQKYKCLTRLKKLFYNHDK
ncbi:MAG: sigma-70 family RNA polymerase sigma factor [Chitinophagia bacterium]|nr:sigma-70 family RNA polymerase sigma factor [Chitinophagia bacterium]